MRRKVIVGHGIPSELAQQIKEEKQICGHCAFYSQTHTDPELGKCGWLTWLEPSIQSFVDPVNSCNNFIRKSVDTDDTTKYNTD